MAVITISREYGTGGEYVEERLCKKLNYTLISKEIIDYISILTNTPHHVVKTFDEESHSNFAATMSKYFDVNIMKDIFNSESGNIIEKSAYIEDKKHFFEDATSIDVGFDSDVFQKMMERIIKKISAKGNAVILGKGGQCILKGCDNVYHFRLYAPIEDRIKWVMSREKLRYKDAKEKIEEIDHRKKNFIKHYYNQDIDDKYIYHACINMSIMNLEQSSDFISSVALFKN